MLMGRQKEETAESLDGHGAGKTKTVLDKVEGKAQHRKLSLTSTRAPWHADTHTRESVGSLLLIFTAGLKGRRRLESKSSKEELAFKERIGCLAISRCVSFNTDVKVARREIVSPQFNSARF